MFFSLLSCPPCRLISQAKCQNLGALAAWLLQRGFNELTPVLCGCPGRVLTATRRPPVPPPAPLPAEADCKCTGIAAGQYVPTFNSPFYGRACGAIAKDGNTPLGTLTQCQRYQFTGRQRVSECEGSAAGCAAGGPGRSAPGLASAPGRQCFQDLDPTS